MKKIEGADDAFLVYGVYDIIAMIKAESMDKLKEMVTLHIRKLGRVRSTLIVIVGEEPK